MNVTNVAGSNLLVLKDNNWELWRSQLTKLMGAIDCKSVLTERYSNVPGDELKDEEKIREEEIARDESAGDADVKAACLAKRKEKGIYLIVRGEAEEKRQDKAMFVLGQSLDETDKRYVINCETVRQQIEMLQRIKVRPQNLYTLNEELMKIRWQSGETATAFLFRLNELKAKIELARGSKEDSAFVTKLLKEMPHFLNWTKLALQSELQRANVKPIEWRDLCERVQLAYQCASADHEDRKERNRANNSNNNRSNGEQRRFTRNDNQNAAYGSFYANRKKCHGCGSIFHLIRNCPNRRAAQSGSGEFQSRFQQVTGAMQSQRLNQSNQDGQYGQSRANGGQANQCGGNAGGAGQRSNGQNHNSRSNDEDQERRPSNLAELVAQSRTGNQRVNNVHQRSQFMVHYDLIEPHAYVVGQNQLQEDQFMSDDGSSHHVVNDRGAFTQYRKFGPADNQSVESINGGRVSGIGVVPVISRVKGEWKRFELSGVLLIESSPVQIFSQRAARSKGMNFRWSNDDVFDYIAGYAPDGDHLVNARARIAIPEKYCMTLFIDKQPGVYSAFLVDFRWHNILSHADYQRIYNTEKVVSGMKVDRTQIPKETSCSPCIEGKDRKRTFDHDLIQSETPAEVIHCDIGEMTTSGLFGQANGYVCFAVFVDEFSRFCWTYPMRDQQAKTVKRAFEDCFIDIKSKLGYYPKFVHLDKGTNLMSETIGDVLRNFGIKKRNSAAYNHQQNGLAEKSVGDLKAASRTVRMARNLPKKLWPESLNYVTYTGNRLWKRSIKMTPFEALLGKRPDMSHVKSAFGDPVYMHVNSPMDKKKYGGKEGQQAIRGIFVGYTDSTVIFRILNESMTKVTEETGVRFLKQYVEPPKSNQPERVLVMPDELIPVICEDSVSNDKQSEEESKESDDEKRRD